MEKLYTTTEAAIKIGLRPSTMRYHVRKGHIATIILPGGDHAINADELERFRLVERKPGPKKA
jgi:predicted site-specific integrase-resolvase